MAKVIANLSIDNYLFFCGSNTNTSIWQKLECNLLFIIHDMRIKDIPLYKKVHKIVFKLLMNFLIFDYICNNMGIIDIPAIIMWVLAVIYGVLIIITSVSPSQNLNISIMLNQNLFIFYLNIKIKKNKTKIKNLFS